MTAHDTKLIFILLVGNQLVATITFMLVYALRSDWRASAVGRHLMWWSGAAGWLDAAWLSVALVPRTFSAYVVFGAQAALGLLTWWRVRLVLKAQGKD